MPFDKPEIVIGEPALPELVPTSASLLAVYQEILNVCAPVPPLANTNVAVIAAFPAASEKLVNPEFPPGLMPFATEADAVEAADVP